MIIWSGWGFLVAVVVFGCCFLMEIATEGYTGDDKFYQDSAWAFPMALVAAAILVYICDRMIKPDSGVQNSLFFIPMKWWTPLLGLIAFATIVYRVANKAPG
jgi:hypothetical protein